ncbi:MAG: glycosyltransferase [Candidatus Jordarchaeaceae archaeon]
MKVYFITRFSIFDPQFRGFRLTKNYDQEEYERRLFDKNRLNQKFKEFQNITLPSIIGQSCKDWEWIIYTSDRMPEQYMKRLCLLLKDYTKIKVITVKNFKEFFDNTSSFNYEKPFATVRIDDDDGLNRFFVEKLQQYSEYTGSIVCFTEGRLVKYKKDRLIIGKRISERNNAQGLAGIGLNIYNCGRHSDIDTRYNVIYDSTPDMFLMACSPFTDTKRGFNQLERILGKFKRLLFLIFNQPQEIRKEFASFIWKRFRN